MISSGGSDTYIFGVGSGQDTLELTASTTYNETSTIQMAGLALADVTFSRDVNNPYDLVIKINGINETFTVKNFAWHTTDVYFQFSDVLLDWHSDVTRSLPEVWAGTDGNDRLYAWGYSQAVMNGNAGDDDLNGTQYDDILNGGEGNDQLSGGMVNTSAGWVSGNDTLDGGAGDDVLTGMQGNDILIGGTGNDTYWFNLGDGQDTIQEHDYTPGNVDTIRLGPGIAASDLVFTRNGMDLVLGIAGTADQITIQKWGWNEAGRIERIVLADGTTLTDAYIAAHIPLADTITGSSGNDSLSVWTGESGTVQGLEGDDSLFGLSGNDTLIGGTGNDVLVGNLGDDTYVFNLGDGQDTIIEYGGNLDTIRFGAGIAASNITFARSGMNLVLGIVGTTDQITIQGWGSGYGYAIDRIEFADGTVWDQAKITAGIPSPAIMTGTSGNDSLSAWAGESVTLQGLEGDDNLFGQSGNNTLAGGIGNDLLSGGSGDDTYVFNLGDGHDLIVEEAGYLDTLKFGAGITAGNITGALNGTDLVLSIAGTTDQITIQNWGYGAPWGIDCIEFADGAVWNAAQIANLLNGGSSVINGTEEADYLFGTTGDDVINGLGGDDTLLGVDGNDILNGGDGYDFLDGGMGNDVLDGGAGNDYMVSNGGFDTFKFGLGSGQDVIALSPMGMGSLVQMGAGIAATDISAMRGQYNAMDLVLSINGTTDTLTLQNYFMNPFTPIHLADGTTLDANSFNKLPFVINGTEGADWLQAPYMSYFDPQTGMFVPNDALINGNGGDDFLLGADGNDILNGGDGYDLLDGGMGNDVLEGANGNDTLGDTAGNNLFNGGTGSDSLTGNLGNEFFIGGAGNDTITTGTGADVIAFNSGDGQDTVVASTGMDNTLSLGGGINYVNLAMSKTGNDLILNTGNGDQITLQNWYVSADNHSVANLQIVLDGATYNPASSDTMLNQQVQTFDFATLANNFDQALAANPTLTSWSMTDALLTAHLSASDTAALGGDLAYQYNLNNSLAGMGLASAQTVMNDANFGSAPQALRPLAELQTGAVRLG